MIDPQNFSPFGNSINKPMHDTRDPSNGIVQSGYGGSGTHNIRNAHEHNILSTTLARNASFFLRKYVLVYEQRRNPMDATGIQDAAKATKAPLVSIPLSVTFPPEEAKTTSDIESETYFKSI